MSTIGVKQQLQQQPTTMASSTTVHHDEIHLHVKKPGTPNDEYPQARCRICSQHGRKRDTRYVCLQCPKSPGLCSKSCFNTFHELQGFEIISAARRLRSETAPEQPLSTEGQPEVGLPVIQEQLLSDERPPSQEGQAELSSAGEAGQPRSPVLSDEAFQRRLENEHIIAIKPPTKKKKYPKLACVECRHKTGARVERRTICQKCETGFCSYTCLREHHVRKKIFIPSSQEDQHTNDYPSIPGTSSQVHHIAGRSYPRTSTPLHTSPLSSCTFETSITLMNTSATSWQHRGPHTPKDTPPVSTHSASRSSTPDPVQDNVASICHNPDVHSAVQENNPPVRAVRKRARQHSSEERRITRSQKAARTEDGFYEALDYTVSSPSSSEEEA